jgi:hypothetical protein
MVYSLRKTMHPLDNDSVGAQRNEWKVNVVEREV